MKTTWLAAGLLWACVLGLWAQDASAQLFTGGGGSSSVNVSTATGTLACGNGGTGVTACTGSGNAVLSTAPTFTAEITVSDATNSAADTEIHKWSRSRADSTAPVANFGAHESFYFEGFTNGSSVEMGKIGFEWLNNQTNDTTDRDSIFYVTGMKDNALGTVLTHSAQTNAWTFSVLGGTAPALTLSGGASSITGGSATFTNFFSTGAVSFAGLEKDLSQKPMFSSRMPAGALVASTVYGGAVAPQAWTVTSVRGYTSVSGGTGTGKWQITDGTNTCDCSFTCNAAAGPFTNACTNNAGTGCVFASAASLSLVWGTTSACTTTQPTLINADVYGNWQ